MVAQRPSEGRKAEKTVLGQRRITKRVPRSGPGHKPHTMVEIKVVEQTICHDEAARQVQS